VLGFLGRWFSARAPSTPIFMRSLRGDLVGAVVDLVRVAGPGALVGTWCAWCARCGPLRCDGAWQVLVRSLGPGARGALVVVRCVVMARGRSWCARWGGNRPYDRIGRKNTKSIFRD
jgi:hypothetical protein